MQARHLQVVDHIKQSSLLNLFDFAVPSAVHRSSFHLVGEPDSSAGSARLAAVDTKQVDLLVVLAAMVDVGRLLR